MREAAAAILAEQAGELKRCRRGARAGDVDAVHDTRVATRRIRAALRVFGASRRRRRALRRRLRKLATALGRVRDLDVMTGLLERQQLHRLGAAELGRVRGLLDALRRRRRRALQRLRARLTRARVRAVRRRIGAVARRGRAGTRAEPAGRGLETAVTSLADAVAREPAMLEVAPDAAATHRLRIAFKRLRYALEFHAGAGDLAFEAELRIARAMQDCLGELHDTDLLLARLEEGAGPFAGPWPQLLARLRASRLGLLRRFAVLRTRWRARTAEPPVEVEEPRFVALEPAAVQLRLVTGSRQIASAMIR